MSGCFIPEMSIVIENNELIFETDLKQDSKSRLSSLLPTHPNWSH